MTPILGILASGISGNLWAPSKDYDSIATTTLATSTATITFSSIPSTYKHLQLRVLAKGAFVSNDRAAFKLQFNGDTASNYNTHNLMGDGASVSAGSSGSQTYMFGNPNSEFPSSSASVNASMFGVAVIDFLDYTDTNKFTTGRFLSGWDNNSTLGRVIFQSGLWRSTSAVTSISITSDLGNWAQYSQFALYGIKG